MPKYRIQVRRLSKGVRFTRSASRRDYRNHGDSLVHRYRFNVGLPDSGRPCDGGICIFHWLFICLVSPRKLYRRAGYCRWFSTDFSLGIATFGIENMAFIIFLTATFQALIWKFNWQRYLLMAVPGYLVEGLLAGIGLKIALKFLPFLWMLPVGVAASEDFWTESRMQVIALSAVGVLLFLGLFQKFKDTKPALPYFALIVFGIMAAFFVEVKMLKVEDIEFNIGLPVPNFDSVWLWLYAFFFAMMLAVVDVIEQVMSNAAIEKIDPLKRPCNSNNSLLAIWVSNMGASFFGGMTNLDGLAKSSTNRLAGAYTKLSVLVIGLLITFFVFNVHHLDHLPYFALAIIIHLSASRWCWACCTLPSMVLMLCCWPHCVAFWCLRWAFSKA